MYELGNPSDLERFRRSAYQAGEQCAEEEGGPISEDDALGYIGRFFSEEYVDQWDKAEREFKEYFYMGADAYYQREIT